MSLSTLIRGTGRRRRSPEQWDALEEQLSAAQRAATAPAAAGAVRCVCPARLHGDWWAYSPTPLPCPFCAILTEQQRTADTRRRCGELEIELGLVRDHLKDERARCKTLQERSVRAWADDANALTTSEPAPMDIPGSCFATGADETVHNTSLAELAAAAHGPRAVPDTPAAAETTPIADVNAQTQPVDVRALRNAAGLGATTVMPVVALPPDLEPAQLPPVPKWPPVHLAPTQTTTWTGAPRPSVTPSTLPGPSRQVQLAAPPT